MFIAAVVVIGLGVMLGIRQLYPRATAENDNSAAFLQQHWRVPIPLQGTPPATYSPLEASLYPQDCGVCHPQQYQDWQSSLHSRSMGPGVYGQLLEMDAASTTLCATCHTPLSEQIPQLEQGGNISRIRRLMHNYSTPVWSVRGVMSVRTSASDRHVVQNCPPARGDSATTRRIYRERGLPARRIL
jgi:hypothetical protein